MTQTASTTNEVLFGPGETYTDVGLVCTCGRAVNRFIGFRIFCDKSMASSVICSCEAGHEQTVSLMEFEDD